MIEYKIAKKDQAVDTNTLLQLNQDIALISNHRQNDIQSTNNDPFNKSRLCRMTKIAIKTEVIAVIAWE